MEKPVQVAKSEKYRSKMSSSIAKETKNENLSEMTTGSVGDTTGSGKPGVISVEQILAALRGATEEQRIEILGMLSRGNAVAPSAVSTKKTAGRPKKVVAVATPAPLPESDGGDAPSAAAYRLAAEDIDMSTCLGRKLTGGEDKRWKPVIYRESQCGSGLEEGCDLCKTCQRRLEKFVEAPKAGPWTGRVSEEPLGWVHMLGTEWAEEKKPRFSTDGSVHDATSDHLSEASAPSAASSKKSVAETAAKKTEKASAVALVAAAKKAEKEAAAAAKKAEKEAAAAAKKVEKEEAAAAKKAEKEAAAAAKKTVSPPKKSSAKTAPVEAKAATETEAADAAGELKLIDGTLYMVRAENVYEYDEISEKAADFVGRLTADETIDTDAEEVVAE